MKEMIMIYLLLVDILVVFLIALFVDLSLRFIQY